MLGSIANITIGRDYVMVSTFKRKRNVYLDLLWFLYLISNFEIWIGNLCNLQSLLSPWANSWCYPTTIFFVKLEVLAIESHIINVDLMWSLFLIGYTYLSGMVCRYIQTSKGYVLRCDWRLCSNYKNHAKVDGSNLRVSMIDQKQKSKKLFPLWSLISFTFQLQF